MIETTGRCAMVQTPFSQYGLVHRFVRDEDVIVEASVKAAAIPVPKARVDAEKSLGETFGLLLLRSGAPVSMPLTRPFFR